MICRPAREIEGGGASVQRPSIELPGFEADDIMGTLARRAEKEGIDAYLVTGDKDFMQLISAGIKMYRPGKAGDEWELWMRRR